MATATLSHFTVPVPSDSGSSTQGLLMPKLSYRFRVLLENFGGLSDTYELTKQVMDFTRPQVKFDDVVLDVYNSKIHLVGKTAWDPVTLTIRDDVSSTVQKIVGSQMQKQFDYTEQASARAGGDYKFILKCQLLDGGNGAITPEVVEQWTLVGCLINTAAYSKMDYKLSDPATITLTIHYDNATQSQQEDGAPYGIGGPILMTRPSSDMATGIQK